MKDDSPSSTALLIARCLLLASRVPALRTLLAPGEEESVREFLGCQARRGWLGLALRSDLFRAFLLKVERHLLPGIVAHYLARKRWIEREVRASLGPERPRCVVVGAGFDGLALRLGREMPEARVIEIDHPATQRAKQANVAPPPNLGFIPTDLSHGLPQLPSQPSVVIAEGLTMYLTPDRAEALLGACARLAGPGGRVIFTFMEPDEAGRLGFHGESRWISRWLRWRGEPFHWGCLRRDLPAVLERCGLRPVAIADHESLRTEILRPLGLGHLPLARGECLCVCQPIGSDLLCNDVHSRLNPVTVAAVHHPASAGEVADLIRAAAARDQSISICGRRHAMGGQQFGEGTLLLDNRHLTALGEIDTVRGTIEAGAGWIWPDLIAALHAMQEGTPAPWTIRQKQTGADDLSLGGALSANIHGRGLHMAPFIGDVEAFTLVDAAGTVRRCSRTENSELFRLAIGGYGGFGVITSLCLRLARRQKLERKVAITTIDHLQDELQERLAGGALYGDFQFAIDASSPDFLHRGILTTYRPTDSHLPAHQAPTLTGQDWSELLHLAHSDPDRAFELYSRHYLETDGALYWSDTHQLTVYREGYHHEIDCRLCAEPGTEMITEVYVPRHLLADFMNAAAADLRERSVPVIYGTVRWIRRDEESYLPWAREDYACVIFNLHVVHAAPGPAIAAFRSLIDLALDLGGCYYLTYHRWARPDQVLRAYPRFPEFQEAKKRLDPAGRFRSEWWRHMSA